MMHSVVEQIFSFCDYKTLTNAERVSPEWHDILQNERIWRALIERNVATDRTWRIALNLLKSSASQPRLQPRDDDIHMSRRTCQQIAELQTKLIALLSSSAKLLSASLEAFKLLSTSLELLRSIGFADAVITSDSDSES